MWATGTPDFDRGERAGQRRVDVAGDDHEVGLPLTQDALDADERLAVCSACVPEPTPRNSSGRGSPSSSKKTSDIASS